MVGAGVRAGAVFVWLQTLAPERTRPGVEAHLAQNGGS